MLRTQIENKKIKIFYPMKKIVPGVKEDLEKILNNYSVEIVPIKAMTLQQMRMIYALINQFSEHLAGGGSEYGYMKDILKIFFAEKYEIPNFSLSPDSIDTLDIDTANRFIEYLIELGLDYNVPIVIKEKNGRKRFAAQIYPDAEKYVYICLKKRICAVCNKPHDFENGESIDLEHWDTVASTAGGYKYDDGLKGRFISLCRKHHIEKHFLGQEKFKNKYYVEGIYLKKEQVRELKNIYTRHFKAFDNKNTEFK
ncbi:hypothetical protein JMUB3935_1526 [Leptotrichia trevisanii]|uniref:Uncharacterized protein n=1 Tax=Leptotrichia trevisanii TaxID=109328 RepID=A0A510KMK9_9FUSO|nr:MULTISPECIES: putative HNHc nuclease [Leptotrichia]BBM52547.1 hypothetical protein JMUB3935_1526 [Leptotrichia trevisanii]